MSLVKTNQKRILFRGLVVTVAAIGLLAYGAGWGPIFASHSLKNLSEGVVKLTPSIPGMGQHWANLDDMPLGPIYLVHKEEVIGVEFMYTQDMLGEVKIPTPEGEEIFYELANLEIDHPVNHMDVGFMPEGHEGFAGPHWDIHSYFISHAEHLAIPGEAASQVKDITITLKRYEYQPGTITVHQGDVVRLKLKTIDVAHGFGLPEFGVNVEVAPGKPVEVEFVAGKKGTFDFRCTVMCGPGHPRMRGRLVVE